MTKHPRNWFTSKWAFLLYGLIGGALVILAIRFTTYNPQQTHYHANFAVYINGQKELFKDPKYYQETVICTLHGSTPLSRAHMHDETPGVIHVHDQAVTWGQFFENLGWEIGPDFLYDGDQLYTAGDGKQLNIILNGQNMTGLTNITDQVIGDRDRLLVSFGNETQDQLNAEFKTVPNNAAHYDETRDPASCQGADETTLATRLKHLF